MLNITKIREIITLSIDKDMLTVQDLKGINISDKEINEAITNGILRKEKGDYYIISCQEKIYDYGVDLIQNNQYDIAIKCFEKCIELKPTHRDSYLQLILIHITRKKYEEAFDIFDAMLRLNNPESIKDNNFLLYLLSLVSNYPDKYRNRVLGMEYDDILITSSDKKYSRIQEQNKFRTSVFQNKLHQAQGILKRSQPEDFPSIVEKKIFRILLSRANELDQKLAEYFLSLVKEKDYSRIILLLDKKRQKNKISLSEIFTLFIAKNIIWISEKRKIPKIKVTEASNLKEALKGNNFGLALQINNDAIKNTPNNQNKTIITLLLIDINKLIKEVIDERKAQIQKDGYDRKRIEDIAHYIKENNIGMDEATTKFSLTAEEIILIKLIYVIDYYTEENYSEGDKLYQEVETSENKTAPIISLLNEIKSNKTSYKTTPKSRKLKPQ